MKKKILNIFPGSVQQLNMVKIILANCIGEVVGYLPHNSLWLNRLFKNLTNLNEKICLALDCRSINPNSPGRFRTETDNPEELTCYFNVENNDQLFNVFLSRRIRNSEMLADAIHFQIERVESRTKNMIKTFDPTSELKIL